MAIPRALLGQVRRLDEYELRRLLIVVRGLLVHVDGPPDDEPDLPPTLTYRRDTVSCGKDSCPHGPYWYAYGKEEGRTRKRSIGRHLPGEALEPVVPNRPDHPAHRPDHPTHRPDHPTHRPDHPAHRPDHPAHRPDHPTHRPDDRPTPRGS